MHRPRAPFGFTLLEVVIAVSISIVVLSVAMGLFVQVAYAGKRARAKAELAREALFAGTVLADELRLAGLGVPKGRRVGGGAADVLRGPLGKATATELLLVADLPRPDASFSAFGVLHGRPTRSRTILAWHTENNGACARHTDASLDCDVSAHSLFFAEQGCDVAATDRVCAWGTKRVVAGEWLVVGAGDGTWQNVRVASTLETAAEAYDAATRTGGVRGLRLDAAAPSTWPMDSYASMPFSVVGQPFVASVDRVFWRFDAGRRALSRRFCFGPVDPAHASWAAGSTSTPEAVPNTRCTREEVMARDVVAASFAYLDENGAPTTNLALIRRVDWSFTLEKNVHRRVVRHDERGSVDLRGFD